MSPEYAMGGLFSEKSDVYSFGVLLLEMVSGTRNTCFHYREKYLNLLGYDHAADRPTMSVVVLMLSNEIDLPHPKQPTFTIQSLSDVDLRSQCNKISSGSKASLSIIEGR
ncbi:G-type lectin S-receptor-like serine/threonine-protein kinase SD1-13 [Camellia sinensis]|uniref:G-type lectin S-receptor-like serine/threonine-protein kinase SD1-13 n=1 Tax=Camellia sinensis TaxID=4442 RepID=UPI00103609D4|nr:G-type lectin S-receptor-like serine/threonine-protein kinase SD1-13 [Camellia sinensis]